MLTISITKLQDQVLSLTKAINKLEDVKRAL